MKSIIRASVIFIAFSAVSLTAQTPGAGDQQLLNLVQQLTSKQAELTDNQGKIETKVSSLAEAVRTSRILMSRAGGLHGKKPTPK
jgi:hypothetical protein